MRFITFVTAFLLASGGMTLVGGALAQDDERPGEDVRRFVPEAIALGEGWVIIGEIARVVPSDTFRDGVGVTYGGPEGARVTLNVLALTDSQVAIRRGWDEAGDFFDRGRWRLDASFRREDDLRAMPLPIGCDEARRTDGFDEMFGLPTGITLCAIDPDIIILVTASGDVLEQSGYAAADAVVAEAITVAGTTDVDATAAA